jgi:class 3 adenylate cyclase
MAGLTPAEAAERAGVDPSEVDDFVRLRILRPDADGRLSISDVRRIGLLRMLEDGGLPREGIAAGFEQGLLTLDFVEGPEYQRFAMLTGETFEAAAARTNVPIQMVTMIREAAGLGAAQPGDLMREDELQVLPFVAAQVRLGFDPIAIERLLRAMSDNTRKLAEAEAEWWRSQVTEPGLEAGRRGDELADPDQANNLNRAEEAAMLAIFHAQQAQTWSVNIFQAFGYLLEGAGLYQRPDRPPTICFLDITGYTRLTQERGDRAAAELAETLGRIVNRTSMANGGRAVKWLGDGVMFWFRDPGPGVLAALDMVDGVRAAGLPPAHVGLHIGPVITQQGDYYGQTVNISSRIADYARPGEVLVSRAIVDAAEAGSNAAELTFAAIGPVELKGVSGAMELHSARRSA